MFPLPVDKVRVGGDNGVEEGIDGGKGSGVDAYIVLYIYLVSAYRPSNSPLPQSVHFIPLLFHYSLKIGGGLGGADDREEALEGDQELDEPVRPQAPTPCHAGRGWQRRR